MTVLLAPPAKMKEERTVHVANRPITFAEFLDLTGEDDDIELVRGVLVEKMAAQPDHERRFARLTRVIGTYVEKQKRFCPRDDGLPKP